MAAAVLDAGRGAALSHSSAAAWWGHRGSKLESPIHVATTGSSRRVGALGRIHKVRSLPAAWVTDRNGVRVVRPELVALHLFAQHRPERAERLVDSLWGQGLLGARSIHSLLEDLGEKGRNGTAGLRGYLRKRGMDYQPPQTGLESRVAQILDSAGIPMRRQVDSGDDRHWTGRVDFRHVCEPLVLEVQSELHHTSFTDRQHDASRHARLRTDGFVVVEVTDVMVWTDPAAVVRTVREGLAAISRSVGPRSVVQTSR